MTGKGQAIVGPPNMSMWQDWDTEESRQIPLTLVTDGIKQWANDAKILFLSESVIAGKTLFDLIGGNNDPATIEQTQRLLDQCQEKAKKMKPLAMNAGRAECDPEKNDTRSPGISIRNRQNPLIMVQRTSIAFQR